MIRALALAFAVLLVGGVATDLVAEPAQAFVACVNDCETAYVACGSNEQGTVCVVEWHV